MLLLVVGALVALHFAVLSVAYGDDRYLDQAEDERYLFFDADHEISLPTWWQQSVLIGAAALALLLAAEARRSGRSEARHWRILAAVLLFVSIDEGTQIHERLTEATRGALDVDGGLLHYAWIVPAALLLVVFVAAFARLWWRLPDRPRALLGAAGVSYVLGGLVVEALGGAHEADHGKDWGYTVLAGVEEGLEMVGQVLIVHALLLLLALRLGRESFTFGFATDRDLAEAAA